MEREIAIALDLIAIVVSLGLGKTLLPVFRAPKLKVVTRADNPRFYWLMIALFSLNLAWCVANLVTSGAFALRA